MKAQIEEVLRSPHRLVLLLLLALTAVYLYGASLQNQLVNTDPSQIDQEAYLNSAIELRQSGYNYLVPRNRMPIYPLLQSLIYKPGMSETEFFTTGKDFNTYLSLVILVILYLLFKRYFSALVTLNLMLITAFTFFIFKAPFFQVELLFYFLNFIVFLLMLRMFRNPSNKIGVFTGFMLGISFMTKASILLQIVIFLSVMVGWILIDIIKREPIPQLFRQKVLPLCFLLLTFLLTISVYISNSKKVYGHYFYNVNTTFYIWYDSWPEAKAGTIAHGDRVGWPNLPDDEIPSLSKYFREHTLGQMIYRIQRGLVRVLLNSLPSYGYFVYFVIYSVLFFTLSVLNWRVCFKMIKKHFWVVAFVAAYFVIHLFAVAWFSPIASGNRFILAYFLPYMFVLVYVLRSTERFFGTEANRLFRGINIIVLVILAGHIGYIMTSRIGSFFGGL